MFVNTRPLRGKSFSDRVCTNNFEKEANNNFEVNISELPDIIFAKNNSIYEQKYSNKLPNNYLQAVENVSQQLQFNLITYSFSLNFRLS